MSNSEVPHIGPYRRLCFESMMFDEVFKLIVDKAFITGQKTKRPNHFVTLDQYKDE